jgi:hypothetical protein
MVFRAWFLSKHSYRLKMSSTKGLRKSYVVESRHGELYTGGPVALHPALGLLLPQAEQLNTVNLNSTDITVSPIPGVRPYAFKLSFPVCISGGSPRHRFIRFSWRKCFGANFRSQLIDANMCQLFECHCSIVVVIVRSAGDLNFVSVSSRFLIFRLA